MSKKNKLSFDTLSIHAGQSPDPTTGAKTTPLFLTSTYVQAEVGVHKGYEYSRTSNPTRTAFEKCVAALETGEENTGYGLAFASGCAATSTVMHLLNPGDHVIASDDLYGGTFRLFDKVFTGGGKGLEYTFADLTQENALEAALTKNTKMLWIETPTNPMLKIVDLEKCAKFAQANNILLVVDNTFMSPYFQKPFQFGADIIVHSTTKFLNGHADVVGGVAITKNQEIADRLYFLQNSMGPVAGPMDAWLALRGLKTLHLRMERHEQNAKKVVDFLSNNSQVEKVIYPGLASHPGHEIAKKQMTGFGGMISFHLKGNLQSAKQVAENTKLFALAESLGGVESLIEHPAIMTHASVPKDVREKLGISDTLLRISVGVESAEDLIQDLEQAFAASL